MKTMRSIIKPSRRALALHRLSLSACILALAGFALAPAARSGGKNESPRVMPPNARAFGKSLTEWLTCYWQWWAGGSKLEESKVGKVQLMPLPAGEHVAGSFTPDDPGLLVGELDITVPPGTPFVLPLFAWVGESYDPDLGIPDDPPVDDDALLDNVIPVLTIDGRTIIDSGNMANRPRSSTSFRRKSSPRNAFPALNTPASTRPPFSTRCRNSIARLRQPLRLRQTLPLPRPPPRQRPHPSPCQSPSRALKMSLSHRAGGAGD